MINPEDLDVVMYPDPVLRQKARQVGEITEEVRAVAARMIELMHEYEGVGLAAPQVGLNWRMFVATGVEDDDFDRVFINPEIEIVERELEPHEEGCLSLPGITADIRRPQAVRITATDLDGNTFTLEAGGYQARIWQHELDHLNGVLIIDKLNPRDRLSLRKRIKEMEAGAVG